MNLIERHHQRRMGLWLLICCLVLFSLIMIGGATRLTGSGLTMVVWEPVTGVVTHMNEADWQIQFGAYRDTTEYQTVKSGMALHEIKNIYRLSFGHRILASPIVADFALPLP